MSTFDELVARYRGMSYGRLSGNNPSAVRSLLDEFNDRTYAQVLDPSQVTYLNGIPENQWLYNDQGHLVESYQNIPPGIQDLPTGPYEGTVKESPAAYKKGGMRKCGYTQKYQTGGWKDFEKSRVGKFIDAKGLRRDKDHLMATVGDYFGYEQDEAKDLALDAGAIINPAADFAHAATKAKEGKYTDAALYAGFGILPFGAGPLVKGTKQ